MLPLLFKLRALQVSITQKFFLTGLFMISVSFVISNCTVASFMILKVLSAGAKAWSWQDSMQERKLVSA